MCKKLFLLFLLSFFVFSCSEKDDFLLQKDFADVSDFSIKTSDFKKRECKWIIVHASATDPSYPWTANRLKKFFKDQPPKGRGWSRLGYNDYIEHSGDISFITPINGDKFIDAVELTNNCSGYNSVSHAICMEGGAVKKNGKLVDQVNFTDVQLKKLSERIKYLKSIYPNAKVVPHNFLDTKGKTCPVISLKNLKLAQ